VSADKVFSERELKLKFAICCRPSVCLSVTFVRPTQTFEIFGIVSMPFGTLAIHDLSVKILRRSSQGNPSVTFAISSPDEFLVLFFTWLYFSFNFNQLISVWELDLSTHGPLYIVVLCVVLQDDCVEDEEDDDS